MINTYLKQRYSKLSNLTIVAHSSRRLIGKALATGFKIGQVETSSYLVLSLCFKEYCHTTSLAIDLFSIEDFNIISCYYNGLIKMQPDRQFSTFCGNQIEPILERVGASIRSLADVNESSQ